jgi:hypothetical protein
VTLLLRPLDAGVDSLCRPPGANRLNHPDRGTSSTRPPQPKVLARFAQNARHPNPGLVDGRAGPSWRYPVSGSRCCLKLRILLSTWRLEVFGLVSRSWTQQFGEMEWFERRGLPLGRWVLRHPGPACEPTPGQPRRVLGSGPRGRQKRSGWDVPKHPRRESAAVRSGPGPGSTILPPGRGGTGRADQARESWPSPDPCRRGPSRSTASFERGASGLASGCRASGRGEGVGPRPESSWTAAKSGARVQSPGPQA